MLKLNNTLSKKIETFTPIEEGKVGIYSCGITLYDDIHIGHLKNILSFEVLRNYFELKGFEVTFVRNITDIDDKIIKKAIEKNMTPLDLVNYNVDKYHKLLAQLEIRQPDIEPRVTQFLPEIVSFVKVLEEKDFAYTSDDGVYFNVSKLGLSKYPLSGKVLENNQKSDKNNYAKKDEQDFALWKKDESFGYSSDLTSYLGRPGWHIECSAMHLHTLGPKFDIHAGGADLIFPHHENEISQSMAHNGQNPANFWLHNKMMTKNGQKLSKSLGNSIYVKDMIEQYHIYALKFYLLSAQYDNTQEFDEDTLKAIDKKLKNFFDFVAEKLQEQDQKEFKESIKKLTLSPSFENKLIEALEQNLNTPEVVALIEKEISEFYKTQQWQHLFNIYQGFKTIAVVDWNYSFQNFLEKITPEKTIDEKIQQLIQLRQQYRDKKDFAAADLIRDQLKDLGYEQKDKKIKP